jgi:amino acid permease
VWKHLFITGVLVALIILNFLSAEAVLKSENLINAIKLLILSVFIIGGF